MSDAIHKMVTALFSEPDLYAGVDIGPIEGSTWLSLEQHAGFGPGILVLRMDAEPAGEYHFGLQDFHVARALATALNAWAAFAEPEYERERARSAEEYNRMKAEKDTRQMIDPR
jgi:hypothetical protein